MSDVGTGATPPPDVDLDRVWIGVAAQVWRRQPGPVERTAGRLLRSPGLARALPAPPSLLLPSLMAPAVAAAGIAYAYGPGIDPAWELSRSMAVSDRMVLLVRAFAVFAVNAALGLAASFASGTAAALTFGWLIPMTAVCALALAAATAVRSPNAGVAAGVAGWTITLLSGQAATGQFTVVLSRSALVPAYLASAAVCAAVVAYATRIPKGTT